MMQIVLLFSFNLSCLCWLGLQLPKLWAREIYLKVLWEKENKPDNFHLFSKKLKSIYKKTGASFIFR